MLPVPQFSACNCKGWEPRTSTSTFTQLLSSYPDCECMYDYECTKRHASFHVHVYFTWYAAIDCERAYDHEISQHHASFHVDVFLMWYAAIDCERVYDYECSQCHASFHVRICGSKDRYILNWIDFRPEIGLLVIDHIVGNQPDLTMNNVVEWSVAFDSNVCLFLAWLSFLVCSLSFLPPLPLPPDLSCLSLCLSQTVSLSLFVSLSV